MMERVGCVRLAGISLLALGACLADTGCSKDGGPASPDATRTTVSGLSVDVDASVDCGTDSLGNPVPCPPFTYDWGWGDGGGHGSGDPATHLYSTGGSYPITLVVTLTSSGQQVGAPVTRSVNLVAGNQPPNAAGSCSWDADTWTMVVTDTSSDPNDADLSHLQVIVDWGDGGAKSAVPRQARPQTVTKVYTRIGSFPVTAKALDIQGLSSTYSCALPATPACIARIQASPTGITGLRAGVAAWALA